MAELRVRYNPVLGIAFLAVGVVSVAVALTSHQRTPAVLLGGALCLLGVLYLVGASVVVREKELEVRSPSQVIKRTLPIEGVAGLRMEGDKVFRTSDDKLLANLGWGSGRRADVEALRQAIAAARP